MAILLPQGFKIGSIDAIDSRLVLTKALMLSINDNTMPPKYFALCSDDNALYIYNKSASFSSETGKFSLFLLGELRDLEALVALLNLTCVKKDDLPEAIAAKLPYIIGTGLAMNDGKLEVDLSNTVLLST